MPPSREQIVTTFLHLIPYVDRLTSRASIRAAQGKKEGRNTETEVQFESMAGVGQYRNTETEVSTRAWQELVSTETLRPRSAREHGRSWSVQKH